MNDTIRSLVLISAAALLAAGPAFAETTDEATTFQYHTVKTKEGLVFNVPEDMPIETRNGIQAPIPFDEYMYGKFKRMDLRLNSIDQKLERIEKLLKPPAAPKTESKSEKSGGLQSL